MATESELIQKRREVRDEILALKETIPSARILNALGRAFQPKSVGYWLSNVVLLNFIILGPLVLFGWALGELERTIPLFVPAIIAVEIVIFSLVIAHIAVQATLDDVANRIVEHVIGIEDLSKMLLWFKQTWSDRSVFGYALMVCFLWVLLTQIIFNLIIHQFVGFGFTLASIIGGFAAGLVGYIYVWTVLLISSLKVYQYDMNNFSPADSEIINDISETMTKGIYMLAGLSAVITLVATSNWLSEQMRVFISLPFLLFIWMAILTQFLLTRSTLGVITNRAKWKTLTRLRDKINALEATGDLSDKDTAERLFRLADIHKQIMASKTNTLDLKSVATLFSQLMLPLLGLLLGNLDKLSKLFQK